MINAVPIISASASVLNSAFKVTGLAFQLHGVPDEIRHALELINGVEGDINDARRFLRENEETVDDQLRKRVNKAIDAAERARIAIGKTVEACRVDMDGAEDNASSSSTHRRKKTVAIHHRLTWVLRDRESFKSKERNLEYAHSALLACISEMNLLAKLLPQQPQPASSKSDPEDPILRDFLSNSKAQTSKVFFDLEETLDGETETGSIDLESFHKSLSNLSQSSMVDFNVDGDDEIGQKQIDGLLRRAASRRVET